MQIEQRDGIAQVNQAVTHLDQMTQQNAALVEESTAAAASMLDQAQRLAEVVSVFNVGAVATTQPPRRPRHCATRAPACDQGRNRSSSPRAVGPKTAAKPPAAARLSSSPTPPPAKAASAPSPSAAAPRAQAKGDDDWESF